MFDIGFSELLLVMVIGLVVLGPERLPVAVKTVAGWIRAMRSLAASVQNELTQELKLQELQESLKKAENVGLQNLSPELKASMDELKGAAEAMQRSYKLDLDSRAADTPTSVNDDEALYDEGIDNKIIPPASVETVETTTPAVANASTNHDVKAAAPSSAVSLDKSGSDN